jgi:hypothetical protein
MAESRHTSSLAALMMNRRMGNASTNGWLLCDGSAWLEQGQAFCFVAHANEINITVSYHCTMELANNAPVNMLDLHLVDT